MRLKQWGLAVLIMGLIICIPIFINFIGNELFIYIKSQYYGYIHIFKIEYFPYWSEELMFIGVVSLLLLTLAGKGPRIRIVRIMILVIFVIWSAIANTSIGIVERDGLLFKSPSTYYETQKISWEEASNVTLEIVDRFYGRSNITKYGIINIKANNMLIGIPFSFRNKAEREKLIDVLQFMRQNDIQVKIFSASSEVPPYIRKKFLDTLKSLTVETE